MTKPKLTGLIQVLVVLALSMISVWLAPALQAADLTLQAGVNSAQGSGVATELFGGNGVVTSITNILLFVVGALSVVMIIIGGLRYVVSGGNSTSVTAAKNTILYAIVGLVIAFLAFAAINFVLGSLGSGTGGATNI